LHLFRHIAQKCSAIHKVLPALFRQSDEKSDGAIAQQSLCGVALGFVVFCFAKIKMPFSGAYFKCLPHSDKGCFEIREEDSEFREKRS
jgi:hypothetical protein